MLLNILIGLIGLSIIIIIHEYGHFICAKACGVGVEVFSIGWGRRLVGKTFGRTEYRISMIPIGGYVKLSGNNLVDANNEHYSFDKQTEHMFFDVHPLRRIIIACGGPLANVVFAFLIFLVLNGFGYVEAFVPNKIVNASVLDGNIYPGEQAGLMNGDIIVDINGMSVSDFSDIQDYVQSNRPGKELVVTVLRDSSPHILYILSEDSHRLIGIYPWINPVVMNVAPNSFASIIGIQHKDTIIAVNGVHVENTIEVGGLLASIDKVDTLSVLRDGDVITLEFPNIYTRNNIIDELGVTYISDLVHVPPKPFFSNIVYSVRSVVNIFISSVQGIVMIFSSGRQLEHIVAGPIRITSVIGDATRHFTHFGVWESIRTFLSLCATISIAIAIMNLLPIPLLDGGQIILYILELLVLKKLTVPIVKAYQLTGYAIILLLLGISILSDISFILR